MSLDRERILRDRNRLRFAWFERKSRCRNYAILHDFWEARNEAQETRIAELEVMLAKAQGARCEE